MPFCTLKIILKVVRVCLQAAAFSCIKVQIALDRTCRENIFFYMEIHAETIRERDCVLQIVRVCRSPSWYLKHRQWYILLLPQYSNWLIFFPCFPRVGQMRDFFSCLTTCWWSLESFDVTTNTQICHFGDIQFCKVKPYGLHFHANSKRVKIIWAVFC